jgi:hypothetical protein
LVVVVRLTPADVVLLAELAGLRIPDRDLEDLAESLSEHRLFVEPMLAADLVDGWSELVARWHD